METIKRFSNAQFALMQAVERSKDSPGYNVLQGADAYYNWLVSKEGR